MAGCSEKKYIFWVSMVGSSERSVEIIMMMMSCVDDDDVLCRDWSAIMTIKKSRILD